MSENSCSSCQSSGSGCQGCPSASNKENLNNIKKKILVMSGKGGVGKSSVAVNLAVWLSMQGKQVGLLDIDLHGPSVPKLLDINGSGIEELGDYILPVNYSQTLKVMSVGFLLQSESSPVIWRGPAKHGVIEQFVNKVMWGNLDYLIVDCPPGTGDEALSITQTLKDANGAIVVTTPQEVSVVDVKKCISFCNQIKLPVIGVIENMAGLICPHCDKKIDIFTYGGGERVSKEFAVKFLGSIPIDPEVARTGDVGKPIVESDSSNASAQALVGAFKLVVPEKKHYF